MNKQKLTAELRKLGIKVIRIEFSLLGYLIEMQINPQKCSGWEEIEERTFNGFEVIAFRYVSIYEAHAIFIPTIHSEFNDFVRRCMNTYSISKVEALNQLQITLDLNGSPDANHNFKKYIKGIVR